MLDKYNGHIWPNQVEIRRTGNIVGNNNKASYVGGVFHFYYTQVLLRGEILIGLDNQAQVYGGWMYTFEGTVTILGKTILEGNSGESGATPNGEKSRFILQASQMSLNKLFPNECKLDR